MNGLLLAAQVEKVATRKDRTLAVHLGTNEVTASVAGQLVGLQNQVVCLYISPKEIGQSERDQVDQINPDLGGKSASKRMRNVLFVLFDKTKDDLVNPDFDAFYKYEMEQMIDKIKNRIPA